MSWKCASRTAQQETDQCYAFFIGFTCGIEGYLLNRNFLTLTCPCILLASSATIPRERKTNNRIGAYNQCKLHTILKYIENNSARLSMQSKAPGPIFFLLLQIHHRLHFSMNMKGLYVALLLILYVCLLCWMSRFFLGRVQKYSWFHIITTVSSEPVTHHTFTHCSDSGVQHLS